ncbi:MAG: SDR family NAD(P)-dependent oxidoreductase [Treponema sp.]
MKKIAIITGASAGMGYDFALMLHSFFTVDELWLLARRKDRLTAIAAEIAKQEAAPVVRVEPMDIAGKTGIKNFAAMLEAEKAVCDDFVITLLVNNAGFGTYGPFEETELEREIDMIELNCVALTGFCGAVLPFMAAGSVIINTASLASFMPLGNFAVYGATKAFVLSFSIALAAELKDKGIRVCALCPGSVSTEFANVASGGVRKEVLHGLSSRMVVMHCLKNAVKGKRIIIMTLKWKITAFLSRLLGRYICAAYTFRYCKRPHHATHQRQQ